MTAGSAGAVSSPQQSRRRRPESSGWSHDVWQNVCNVLIHRFWLPTTRVFMWCIIHKRKVVKILDEWETYSRSWASSYDTHRFMTTENPSFKNTDIPRLKSWNHMHYILRNALCWPSSGLPSTPTLLSTPPSTHTLTSYSKNLPKITIHVVEITSHSRQFGSSVSVHAVNFQKKHAYLPVRPPSRISFDPIAAVTIDLSGPRQICDGSCIHGTEHDLPVVRFLGMPTPDG